MQQQLREWQARGGLRLILGLGATAVVLLLAAVVGALAVDEDKVESVAPGDVPAEDGTTTTLAPGQTLPPEVAPAPTLPDGRPAPTTPGQRTSGGGTTPGSTPGPTLPGAPTTAPPTTAGDRTGVSAGEIKFGVHAPITFDGAPLNLAEDPIEGLREVYIPILNAAGGVNGRKITLDLQDDRYTVEGGRSAANTLINDHKNFFVSGTLGVDQIAQVAAEARKRGVPYMAAGGSEARFKDIGMHQIASSYDTHVIKLAEYMATDSAYMNKKIGVSYLNTPYIEPVVQVFKAEAEKRGMKVVATEHVEKPTEQTTYGGVISAFKSAGVEVFVPMQDPITTSRQVAECQVQLCQWTYSFSDFAHEQNLVLELMGGKWGDLKVRGLAGGCYYQAPERNDPAKCAQMGKAHAEWVQAKGEADWDKDGSGGAAGYQIVHFWLKAMKDAGPDLTRERFVAALRSYENYADLVSGPISFKGSSNISHGATKMVVLEAQTNEKYKMLSPGLIDSF